MFRYHERRMGTRTIMDTHQHAYWSASRRTGTAVDPADLVADMDEQGIRKAWLLTWEVMSFEDHGDDHQSLNPANLKPDGTHAGITFSDTLAARDRFPDRFVAGFAPHPMAGDPVARFTDAVRNQGVRVCGEWKCRMWFDDPACLALFRKAGELKCPVVLHLDVPELPGPDGKPVKVERWYGGTVANLERAAQACPDTVFIGHGPGFWREMSGDVDRSGGAYPSGSVTPGGRLHGLFDRNPNVMADLSAGSAFTALSRDPGNARAFVERYSSRLLFGRDDFGGRTLEFLLGLGASDGALGAVLGLNAMRLVP